ncbi:MAG TPA: hypothetical protein VGI39_06255 [Polyangiaceae bacterium]|jgi:hypothetical protein
MRAMNMRAGVMAGLAFVASTTGCASGHHHGAQFPTEAVAATALAVAEVATMAAAAGHSDPDPDQDPPPPLPSYGYNPPATPLLRTAHPSFEPAAALNSIDGIDYSVCHATGTYVGWYHARVTFTPDGAVSATRIDWTAGMAPGAVDCLRSQLAKAVVPPFEGDPVTIGAAFFVP